MIKKTAFGFALILLATVQAFGQVHTPMPVIIEKDGRHALLVDGKPFFMMGGQAHNSSDWPGMLPQVWSAIETMHANTLEIPIYWEQVEPGPGKFDFSQVDLLLGQARQHKVHLVLLWFGTWKNGSNHYMPGWMKADAAKYPDITGKDGKPVDSPSPNVKATMDADVKAFTAVMKHLKQADGRQHTVIMVQVENETGAWGSVRDYSPLAQQLFEGQVPAQLLKPDVLKQLNVAVVSGGTWKEVFGDRADEYFQAWSVASFVGQVAAAGKAVYPLPLYVNDALRDPLTNPSANTYESGGPTDNVIPIWKVAAPAIDVLAPDIYLEGSEKILKVIDLYDRPDNALFVPETGGPDKAKYFYEVVARGGIGFSPFGIDDNNRGSAPAAVAARLEPYALDYAMAGPMMRQLAQWGFDGKITAVVEREDRAAQVVDLGAWKATVSFGSRRGSEAPGDQPNGKIMIVKLGDNQFVLIGSMCHITFAPTGGNAGRAWQYLKVEEGHYDDGVFKPLRILNGDETDWGGPGFGIKPEVLQVSLILR